MSPLGDISQELVVEGLDPVCVSTLFPKSDYYKDIIM